MGEQGRDAQRVQEIRARLQDRWYSAEQTREDVRYLLARLEALDAERDEWKAKAEQQAQLKADFRAAYQAAQMAGYDMEALRDRAEAERDALAGRLAAAEALLGRALEAFDYMEERGYSSFRVIRSDVVAALAVSREQATGEGE